ncbi:DNA polymerase III subunit chi [Hydrogenophaga aquatica]
MTDVAFHFNVPDKPAYLCRLLRKVVNTGMRALVLVPEPLARELDQLLWTFSQEDFISHALASDPVARRDRSSVVLAHQECDAGPRQVLVNCLADVPQGFDSFDRVVEIVGLDDEDRAFARQRWKRYAQQGIELTRYDVAQLQRASAG